jgi:hypothetical protein
MKYMYQISDGAIIDWLSDDAKGRGINPAYAMGTDPGAVGTETNISQLSGHESRQSCKDILQAKRDVYDSAGDAAAEKAAILDFMDTVIDMMASDCVV